MVSYNVIGPYPNKSVSPSEKVEKVSGTFDDIEEPVVKTRQKYLDDKIEKDNTKKYHFRAQSGRSTRWFDIDHEWSDETFCTREPDLYTKTLSDE